MDALPQSTQRATLHSTFGLLHHMKRHEHRNKTNPTSQASLNYGAGDQSH